MKRYMSPGAPAIFGDIVKFMEERSEMPYDSFYPPEMYENSITCYVCNGTMERLKDASFVCMCMHEEGDGTRFRGVCSSCWTKGLWTDWTGDRRKEMWKLVPKGHKLKITTTGQKLLDERMDEAKRFQETQSLSATEWFWSVLFLPLVFLLIRKCIDPGNYGATLEDFLICVYDVYGRIFYGILQIIRSIVEGSWEGHPFG